LVYEIDPEGNNIWEKQVNGTVPHAYRYSACYLAGTVPNAPTITANGPVLQASGGSAYQWYVDGVLIPGATQLTYNATVSGNYQAQVVEAGGCRSPLSDGIIIQVNNVNEEAWASLVQVYPNPANESVRILAPGIQSFVEIIDAQGRIVYSQQGNIQLSTASWASGVYGLRVQSENGIVTRRLIIQH
jgi:hypothetical protein